MLIISIPPEQSTKVEMMCPFFPDDVCDDDENVVIDVMSEDDTSSTTSGSDGGCTSTSHKFPMVAV